VNAALPPRRFLLIVGLVAVTAALLVTTLATAEWFVRDRYYDPATLGDLKLSETPGLVYEVRGDTRTHNAHGFRGPWFDGPVPAGVCRIAVAGDSLAYGGGVPEPETFVRRFANLLDEAATATPRHQVLNTAVMGYEIEQITTNWRVKVSGTPHGIVAYAWFNNDPGPSSGYLNWGPRLVRAIRPHGGQVWKPRFVPHALDDALAMHSRLYLLARTTAYQWAFPRAVAALGDRYAPHWDAFFEAQFRDWLADVVDSGRSMVVVLVPSLAQLLDPDSCNAETIWGVKHYCRDELGRYRAMRALARKLNVPVVDLFPAYWQRRGQADTYRLPDHPDDWSHPNAAGHALLAAELVTLWRAQSLDQLCTADTAGR
jgi:hypothetical protein